MNGPVKMYPMRVINRHDLPVELPNCMYSVKNKLSGHKIQSGEHVLLTKKNLDISEQKYDTHPEMAELKIRQENILKQLAELKEQMLSLRAALNVTTTTNLTCNTTSSRSVLKEIERGADLVINASPSDPPYSLLILQRLWANYIRLHIYTYLHSTVVNVPTTDLDFNALNKNDKINSKLPQLLIRVIWKNVENMELITSFSNMSIYGEANILRYLSRTGPSNWNYETYNNSTEIDSALDICYLLSRSRTKTERNSLLQSLNGKLGKSNWLCNREQLSIADIAASSIIKKITIPTDVNVNLTKWLQRCEEVIQF